MDAFPLAPVLLGPGDSQANHPDATPRDWDPGFGFESREVPRDNQKASAQSALGHGAEKWCQVPSSCTPWYSHISSRSGNQPRYPEIPLKPLLLF